MRKPICHLLYPDAKGFVPWVAFDMRLSGWITAIYKPARLFWAGGACQICFAKNLLQCSIKTILVSLIFLPVSGLAQKKAPSYRLIATIPGPVKFFTTDKLQQVYIVGPDNGVAKYSPDGQLLFNYNNNTLGDLTHIDATNPFNLLLYYPNFQTAITLDRTLNKIGEFNLWDRNFVDLRAVCMARDNGIWLYDAGINKLINLDQDGNLLQESDNLTLLLGVTPQPVKMIYRDNFVYAADPELGILLFDNFAQYVRTLSLKGVVDFQIVDQRLIFKRALEFFLFDTQSFTEAPLPMPEGVDHVQEARLQKDRLYILSATGVEIYLVR